MSAEQMGAFAQRAQERFAASMVRHLAGFSPPLFRALGEAQMRVVVDFGMVRAAAHGFTLRGPVRLYLELMLMLGSHFDTDPQHAWAGSVLADAELRCAEMLRAERLHEAAMAYRREVVGPDDVHALAALRRIRALARAPLPVAEATLGADVLALLRTIHPRQAARAGDAALEALVAKAHEGALRQGFATPRGVTLVALLMLAFGHGCGADPLYPWIAATLRDERISDPQARAARLERKALTWLDHVLTYFASEALA